MVCCIKTQGSKNKACLLYWDSPQQKEIKCSYSGGVLTRKDEEPRGACVTMSQGGAAFSARRDGETYLSLDQPLSRLDLGLAERPSVLGAHVRPYREVGGLIQGLQGGGKTKGGQVMQCRTMKTNSKHAVV